MAAIQFFHHRSLLEPSHDQMLQLERYFGLVRIITNHLTNVARPGLRAMASSNSLKRYLDCEALILKLVQESDGLVFSKLSQGMMESIILAWLSEWDDSQAKRTKALDFRTRRHTQVAWLLESDLMALEASSVKVVDWTDDIPMVPLGLRPPGNPTAFILYRNWEGYQLTALYERRQMSVGKQQEATITDWGKQILNMERESDNLKYRNKETLKYDKARALKQATLGLRKQIIHRLHREDEDTSLAKSA